MRSSRASTSQRIVVSVAAAVAVGALFFYTLGARSTATSATLSASPVVDWVNTGWPDCKAHKGASSSLNGVLTVYDKNNPAVTNYCVPSDWRVDGRYLYSTVIADEGAKLEGDEQDGEVKDSEGTETTTKKEEVALVDASAETAKAGEKTGKGRKKRNRDDRKKEGFKSDVEGEQEAEGSRQGAEEESETAVAEDESAIAGEEASEDSAGRGDVMMKENAKEVERNDAAEEPTQSELVEKLQALEARERQEEALKKIKEALQQDAKENEEEPKEDRKAIAIKKTTEATSANDVAEDSLKAQGDEAAGFAQDGEDLGARTDITAVGINVSLALDLSTCVGHDYAINCNFYLTGDYAEGAKTWSYGDAYNPDKAGKKHTELDLFESGLVDKNAWQGKAPDFVQITSHDASGKQSYSYLGFNGKPPPPSQDPNFKKSLATSAKVTEHLIFHYSAKAGENLQLRVEQDGMTAETFDLGFEVMELQSFQRFALHAGVNNGFIPSSSTNADGDWGYWTLRALDLPGATRTSVSADPAFPICDDNSCPAKASQPDLLGASG